MEATLKELSNRGTPLTGERGDKYEEMDFINRFYERELDMTACDSWPE